MFWLHHTAFDDKVNVIMSNSFYYEVSVMFLVCLWFLANKLLWTLLPCHRLILTCNLGILDLDFPLYLEIVNIFLFYSRGQNSAHYPHLEQICIEEIMVQSHWPSGCLKKVSFCKYVCEDYTIIYSSNVLGVYSLLHTLFTK